MSSIEFMWEQVAGRDIQDVCPFDPTKQYILTLGSCTNREVKELNEYLQSVPWYTAWVSQNLTHDINGDLLWV